LNGKIAAADTIGVTVAVPDRPLDGMYPVLISGGIYFKIAAGTVTVGIAGK
jgi:hypothetical protein